VSNATAQIEPVSPTPKESASTPRAQAPRPVVQNAGLDTTRIDATRIDTSYLRDPTPFGYMCADVAFKQ
jgi:hypothetical protein